MPRLKYKQPDAVFIATAKRLFSRDEETEIDDDAEVQHTDSGAWVRAWVHIDDYDATYHADNHLTEEA